MRVGESLLGLPHVAAVLSVLPEARLVGGCVRDTLLGVRPLDVDVATPAPPEEALRLLERAGLRVVPTGLSHGTVTAVVDGRPVEVTTLRRDVATDGRHAEVAWTADFAEDAARRDFTINALSLDRDGGLHDYFGGVEDLRRGAVRFVGDAARRIEEDFLRVLRFFRFFARYGLVPPDADTRQALTQGAPGIALLSAERVWSELKRLLAAPAPLAAVELAAELGVLGASLPDGFAVERLADLLETAAPADPLLRFAALAEGEPDGLAARLRWSASERVLVAGWREEAPRNAWSDADLRRLLAGVPAEIAAGRAWLAGQAGAGFRLERVQRPIFPLEGRDVLALGVAPGPAVGRLLAAARAWWLDGGCVADPAACRAHLAALMTVTER